MFQKIIPPWHLKCGSALLLELTISVSILLTEIRAQETTAHHQYEILHGGLIFCHKGKIYKETSQECPGGILLKSISVQPFPKLPPICVETSGTAILDLPELTPEASDSDSMSTEEDEESSRPIRNPTHSVSDDLLSNCNRILEENVQLAEYFTRLNHGQVLGYEYKSDTSPHFKIIEAALNVFKAVIASSIVSHSFLDQVYKYFYYLYFDQRNKKLTKTNDVLKLEEVIFALNQCQVNSREMNFIVDGDCPGKILFFKNPTSLYANEHAKTSLSPEKRFDETKHDAIPEVIYKIINFVYSSCQRSFEGRREKLQDLFRVEMQKFLLMPTLQMRWRQKCPTNTKLMQYRSILPYGDLNIIMENLDAAVAATTVLMGPSESQWIKRPLRGKKTSRKKRRISSTEKHEIWDDTAYYCLQMEDYPESQDSE